MRKRHARLFNRFSAFDFECVLSGWLDVPKKCIPGKLPAALCLAQAHAKLGIFPAVEIERFVESTGTEKGLPRKRRVARAEKCARIVGECGQWSRVVRRHVENRPVDDLVVSLLGRLVRGDPSGRQPNVVVAEQDIPAGRNLRAAIARLAAIGLRLGKVTHRNGAPRAGFHDAFRLVGRAIVDDDHLERRRVRLTLQRFQRAPKTLLPVFRRNHHRKVHFCSTPPGGAVNPPSDLPPRYGRGRAPPTRPRMPKSRLGRRTHRARSARFVRA